MSDYFAIPVDAILNYQFEWDDMIPSASPAITMTNVDYEISPSSSPQTLNVADEEEAFSQYQSTVMLQGAVHGVTYQLKATATLSNGEHIVKTVTLRGFNG